MRRFRCAALAAVAVAGFASVLVGNSNSLMAQTTDVSAKTDQELAKENAALRERINRLELERQNAELRDHARRLETKKRLSVAPATTTVAQERTSVAPARIKRAALHAFAADMPVKALVYNSPIAAKNWTGLYVGGQVGGKWLTNDWNTTCVQGGGLFFTCGSALNAIIFPGQPDSSAANSFKTSGLRTGAYLGGMYQVNPWVVGVEGDIAFYNQSSTVGGLLGCSTLACANNAGLGPPLDPNALVNDSTRIKDRYDYSLRLRAGYLVTPDILFYGTGGLAVQQVESTMTCNGNTSPACLFSHSQFQSATLVGYTIGGGLEWKLLQNWLLRGEYRYADYGTYKPSFFVGSGDVEVFANVKVKSQILTAGLAYMFPIAR
jgi:outer membrane immunogenic protein